MLLEIGNHLWQSTLCVVVIAGLCRLLRQDGAHLRYRLWWIASVKFLLPFSLLTAVGRSLASEASIVRMPAVWADTVTVVARPFEASAATPVVGAVLLAAWLTGFLVVLGSWTRRALRLRRILRHAREDAQPLTDGDRRIRVFRTTARIEPGVVGIFRTALLLPAGLDEQLGPAQLEALLTHELCHIRRHDNLTAAVHMLVEAGFWFHPLVWWIGARLIDERERACDERVVSLGHDREIYAESILDVCERYAASPLRCAAGISGSDLKRRIVQIMRYPGMNRLGKSKKLALGTTAALALAIPIVAGLAVQREALAQDNPAQPPARPTTGVRPEAPATAQRPASDRPRPTAPPAPAVPPQPPAPPASQADTAAPTTGDTATEAKDRLSPVHLEPPVYPPRALARGIEGWVILGFTVTAEGETRDVHAVQSSNPLFESAAIESVKKNTYVPRLVNGQAQEVDDVRVKVAFSLDRKAETQAPKAPGDPVSGDGAEDDGV